MLKIKDDVDLSVLEKYGFTYNKTKKTYRIEKYKTKNTGVVEYKRLCCIIIDRYKNIDVIDSELLDVLFDLIEDGLVEKIKE